MNNKSDLLEVALDAMKMKQRVTLWENDGDRAKFNSAIAKLEAAKVEAQPVGVPANVLSFLDVVIYSGSATEKSLALAIKDLLSTAPALPVELGQKDKCQKCGQINMGQTGEYHCPTCGLPTLWDAAAIEAAPDNLEYQLYCNDEPVASASGPGAWGEIMRYMKQYREDGDCEIEAVTRRKVTDPVPAAPAVELPVVAEGCTPVDAMVLREANHAFAEENQNLRKALRFYANGDHFITHQDSGWDTVSGEPTNFFEDEAGTATVEDGSIAAMALRGEEMNWGDEEPPLCWGEPEAAIAQAAIDGSKK